VGWRRLSPALCWQVFPLLLAALYNTPSRRLACHYRPHLTIYHPLPSPPPNYPFFPPSRQPCPHRIWHMATLGPTLAQIRICTLRTILHHNFPLLILQQPSLESTSLPQVLSHAPLAPPPARPHTSLEMVSSTGRHSPTGASGYVGSGYVSSVSHFISLLMVILHHLLGYYMIAIILSVITALITIYHHQIVAQLTPAAHTVKKSVIICISSRYRFFLQSCLTSDHDLCQASRRVGNSDSHPLHHIFSSGVSHLSSSGSATR